MLSEAQKWKSINNKVFEVKITDLMLFLNSHDLNPILFKGWAINNYYPQNDSRVYADIDLSFSKTEIEKAKYLIESKYDKAVIADLHIEFRHLDNIDWDTIFNRTILKPVGEALIRIPCPEDHLRLISIHWLTDGGANKSRLWDVFYLIQNTPDLDLDKCLFGVGNIREKWIYTVISLTNKYLDLNIDRFNLTDEQRHIPAWLTSSLEKQWQKNIPLTPLSLVLTKPSDLIAQLKKRIPPNPIHASVMCEAPFDESSRIPYQIKNFFQRSVPSIISINSAILSNRN